MIHLLIEDHPEHLFLSARKDSDLYPNHYFLLLQKLKQTARKLQATLEFVNMSDKNCAVQDFLASPLLSKRSILLPAPGKVNKCCST